MNDFVKIIRTFFLVVVIFGVLILFFQMVFSVGNQSSHQVKQFTFFNFLLPWIITLGFMIFGAIEMFRKRENLKTIWNLLIILGILELIAIKWQIEFLLWTIGKNAISEIFPIAIGILMMFFVFAKLTLNIIAIKKKK